MAAGVAAGLARYLGVDVMIVRITFVVLTVFSGAGIPLYLAGLLLIPEEGSNRSITGSLIESVRSRPRQPAAGKRGKRGGEHASAIAPHERLRLSALTDRPADAGHRGRPRSSRARGDLLDHQQPGSLRQGEPDAARPTR
jgi:phage shock protein PspC (stress-responsive transcriptional regulator)